MCTIAAGFGHDGPGVLGVIGRADPKAARSLGLMISRTGAGAARSVLCWCTVSEAGWPRSSGLATRAGDGERLVERSMAAVLKPDESDRDATGSQSAVVLERVSFAFDDRVVLRDVSFEIQKGTMAILLDASGSGKSCCWSSCSALLRPDSGRIYVNGQRIDNMPERDLLQARADIGMVFQELALFDSSRS
jgi:ABC-type multidrug transport system fused ATPase/permease subunit